MGESPPGRLRTISPRSSDAPHPEIHCPLPPPSIQVPTMPAPAVSAPSVPRLTAKEELYWLALRLVQGLGPSRAIPLLEAYRTPQALFRAPVSELEGHGLSGAAARSISSGCTFEDAAALREKVNQEGLAILPFGHPSYPAALLSIDDPPLLLFAKGNLDLLSALLVAVVGTRRPSTYGNSATERVAADLAKAGVVIVSGMARGIDTAAHRAALNANGGTIAVFGSGIDHIYPAENRRLSEKIAASGLILSEYPPGTPDHPHNFPARNRIISGISYAVLAVEGAQYSGSAITARTAALQGKEIYAIPGPIHSRMSFVPNLLIKQGARLLTDAEDLLADLPSELRHKLLRQVTQPESPAQLPLDLEARFGPNTPIARSIVAAVTSRDNVELDSLLESLDGYSPSEVIATLFEMELAGMVRQLPGKQFARVW